MVTDREKSRVDSNKYEANNVFFTLNKKKPRQRFISDGRKAMSFYSTHRR